MKSSLSVHQMKQQIVRFLNRFHVMIYTLTVVIGVSVAIFMLNVLVSMSNTTDATPPPSIVFDQATIDSINEFHTTNSSRDEFHLPEGRINPLVE